jgi:hypothetical protein
MDFTMALIARLLLLVTLVAWGQAAQAADVVFPTGSRIGIAPPAGMTPSSNFYGYEDRANNAAIVLVPLPPDAYAELERTISADTVKKQGLVLESRGPMTLPTGKAFLVIGRQQIENIWIRKLILVASLPMVTALITTQIPETAKDRYPDAAIRAALQTLTVRPAVPVEEQLALLPFKVGDLAGFQVAGVMPGRAVMLSDKADPPLDTPPAPGAMVEPHMLVAVAPGGPGQSADRAHFARDVFAAIPNLKSIRITGSEPLRLGNQQGYQIFASAQDPSGGELSIVQWLRFGGSAYMQFVGISRTDEWRTAYPRFRSVRDGIEPR